MELYQEQLVSLLSHSLFGSPSDVTITDEIMQEARLQAVSSLVNNKDYQVFASNIRIDAAHAELTNVLRDIPFVTMKGYASAYYYPNPYMRPMGDVDFYVEPEYYDRAAEALLKAGFSPLNHEHERHEAFRKDKVTFELHSEIKGIPNGLDGIKTDSDDAERRVRHYLSDVVKTAETVSTQHGDIVIPDAFHHGLIMLLHVAGHMINDGGIGLRHLCDWAVYVDKVDISEFKDKLTNAGVWTFACQLTVVSEKYLGLRKMEWSGTWETEFIDRVFEDIIYGGNFGRKGTYRSLTYKASNDSGFISSFITMTKKRFPNVKKHPVLLPGAVIWWGLLYLGKCLTGKRKLVKPKDFREGKNRNELYKQFRLFET